MTTKMIALRRVYSKANRKEYLAGETFHAMDEREIQKFERSKKAERAPEMAKPSLVDIPAPTYQTAAIEADNAPQEEPVERVKRQYRRRDMSAEQD